MSPVSRVVLGAVSVVDENESGPIGGETSVEAMVYLRLAGRLVCGTNHGVLHVVELATFTFTTRYAARRASDDDDDLMFGDADLREPAEKIRKQSCPTAAVASMAVSEMGSRLLVGHDGGVVALYDVWDIERDATACVRTPVVVVEVCSACAHEAGHTE